MCVVEVEGMVRVKGLYLSPADMFAIVKKID